MGLWTKLHFVTIIPAFIVFIVIAVLMGKWLKDKDERIKYVPFRILAGLILILEVIKQVDSFVDGYDLYALPFHYCSLFLYLLPLHAFYKGKYKKTVNTTAFGCCASLFFFMLVMPAIVYGESSIESYTTEFLSFHTVTFHNVVCLYFLLMLTLKAYETDTKRDLKVLAVFFSVYVTIAAVLSQVLKVNFHNLYKCNLAIVEELRLALIAQIGWPGQLIYVAALFVGTILFAYISYFAVKGILYLIDKATHIKSK